MGGRSRSGRPSPSTSTPRRSARPSVMRSATVCLRPSRLEIAASGPGDRVPTPSASPILPSPSRSTPRPPAGSVTSGAPARRTVSVPAAPPPCPPTVIPVGGEAGAGRGPRPRHRHEIPVVGEAVAEDGHGPACRGHRALRHEQRDVDVLLAGGTRAAIAGGRRGHVALGAQERQTPEAPDGDGPGVGGGGAG